MLHVKDCQPSHLHASTVSLMVGTIIVAFVKEDEVGVTIPTPLSRRLAGAPGEGDDTGMFPMPVFAGVCPGIFPLLAVFAVPIFVGICAGAFPLLAVFTVPELVGVCPGTSTTGLTDDTGETGGPAPKEAVTVTLVVGVDPFKLFSDDAGDRLLSALGTSMFGLVVVPTFCLVGGIAVIETDLQTRVVRGLVQESSEPRYMSRMIYSQFGLRVGGV